MASSMRVARGSRKTVRFGVLLLGAVSLLAALIAWDGEQFQEGRIWSYEKLRSFSGQGSSESSTPTQFGQVDRPEVQAAIQWLAEDDRRFGKRFFQKSIAYGGTNTRLRRVLRKLARGQPIVISGVGGSVSNGSNMPRNMGPEWKWPGRLFGILKDLFPNPQHRFTFTGLGGLGSDYFSFCCFEHLDEEADLVLVEHAINDAFGLDAARTFENELRGILLSPKRPAVIAVEALTVGANPLMNAGTTQIGVSRFYDVPYLSLAGPLLPEMIAHPARLPLFFGKNDLDTDKQTAILNQGHVGVRGHFAIGHIVGHYLVSQLVAMAQEGTLDLEEVSTDPAVDRDILDVTDERSVLFASKEQFDEWQINEWEDYLTETQWGSELVQHDVPRIGILDKFDFKSSRQPANPRCFALNNTRQRPDYETVAVGTELSEKGEKTNNPGQGWFEWASPSSRNKFYIMTKSRNAVVRFNLNIVGEGQVGMTYLRSSTLGLGAADCWIDDQRNKKVTLDGKWEQAFNLGVTQLLASHVPVGQHALHCELVEGNEFRITAIQTT